VFISKLSTKLLLSVAFIIKNMKKYRQTQG